MTDEDLQTTFSLLVEAATDYCDTEVGQDRAKASRYYNGEPFGNEVEGRSQVISMDVRDTVQQMLPPLMRIFFGGDKAVEFEPQGPEDVQQAEQATDYVNYIITRDNPGFQLHYTAFKDALVRKTGIFKVWYEKMEKVTGAQYSGLDEQTLAVLLQEHGVEDAEAEQDPETGLYSVQIKRRTNDGRVRIAIIPPEELLINSVARGEEDATLIGHKMLKTRSDLIAMGYDPDEIDGCGDDTDELFTNAEILARRPAVTYDSDQEKSTRRLTYIEAYVRIDYDGDGIAELRKICAIGSKRLIVANEIWDEPGIAMICPDPEYYTPFGLSIADLTMDVELIKSTLLRETLDNLYLTNRPRQQAVEGRVNMDDLLNTEVGGVVRVKDLQSLADLAVPFTAGATLPMIDFMDSVKEQRTGVTKASIGLDANALQSTAQIGVAATVTAARERVELIAHIFAETGIKRLYKLILHLVCQHQDQPRVIRLRNNWVPIDPRGWNANMDMTVNVGLGGGTNEQKIAVLGAVAQKQEMILEKLGPNNPLVNLQNYYNTVTKALALSGIKDTASYFSDPSQAPPQEPQPPAPDPALIIAQTEQQKAASDAQYKQAKLQQDGEKMLLDAQLEREKLEVSRAQQGIDLQIAQIDLEKARLDLQSKVHDLQNRAMNPAPQPFNGAPQ